MIPANICVLCAHLDDKQTCAAFPQGIPAEIWKGEVDHHDPYPGDNGIQFKRDVSRSEDQLRFEPEFDS
jgi:hypothetical protein